MVVTNFTLMTAIHYKFGLVDNAGEDTTASENVAPPPPCRMASGFNESIGHHNTVPPNIKKVVYLRSASTDGTA